ncbi:hypothetical protein Mapa_016843 [Marchantia paleacea]|nr:hypothetical protein Mapa_016843 [Marchantia paleacea]
MLPSICQQPQCPLRCLSGSRSLISTIVVVNWLNSQPWNSVSTARYSMLFSTCVYVLIGLGRTTLTAIQRRRKYIRKETYSEAVLKA